MRPGPPDGVTAAAARGSVPGRGGTEELSAGASGRPPMVAPATLAGLVVASLGFPAVALALARTGRLPPRYTAARLRVGAAVQWSLAVVVVGLVVVVEGRPLAAVGVAPVTLSDSLSAFAVAGAATVVGGPAVQAAGVERLDDAAVFVLAQPTHRQVGLAVTAVVTEELLYWGYLTERVVGLTASPLAAAVLPLVAFLVAHLPGRSVRGRRCSSGRGEREI